MRRDPFPLTCYTVERMRAISVANVVPPAASKGLCETNLMQLNFELRLA